jgi:pentatricopeptide repeat domain-containing protein 1
MQRNGLAPNAITYNTLISAYGRLGRYDAALSIYESMLRAPGVADDVWTLTALMTAAERAGRWEEALRWFVAFAKVGG